MKDMEDKDGDGDKGYQEEARVEKLSIGNKAKSTDKRGGQKMDKKMGENGLKGRKMRG